MADKNLTCKDCNKTFVFTESEQNFYREKGFENEPQRCPDCRAARKQRARGGRNNFSRERQMYDVICANCGAKTQVPFKPNGEKPVYCKDCYQSMKY